MAERIEGVSAAMDLVLSEQEEVRSQLLKKAIARAGERVAEA